MIRIRQENRQSQYHIEQEVEVTKDLFMIKNYDSKDIGKQTIYFVYKDTNIKIPYNIEVISKKPIKLEIKQLPYKIDYLKDEAFEIQGLEVIVTYNDETTELISLDERSLDEIIDLIRNADEWI